jgi:epidermal growth factor receptor substrate 15
LRNKIIVIFFCVIAISLISYNTWAQDINSALKPGEEKVFKRAVNYFDQEDFINAKRDYSQLITLYPRESYFNLAYGACMVYTNEDIPKAIKFLNYAAQNGQTEAYYYIGLAYHLQYMFDRALNSYNKFIELSDSKLLESYPVNRQIKMAKNGEELVKYAYNLNVINNKKINEDKFYFAYELSSIYGEIVKTPNEFKSRFDKKRNYEGLMYVAKQQNKAFFSSYGNNKNNSLDIYFVEQIDGKWSIPQSLSENINTSEDEDYPFLHPNGKVLYFSSKGHNSMGGYDIFSAKYDSTSQSFAKPVNLDFPINTPLDDIMYATDLYGEVAFFASTRDAEAGKLSVFNILVNKSPEIYVLDNIDAVRKHAKLEVNTTITADMQKTSMDSISISDYQYGSADSVLSISEDNSVSQDSIIEENFKDVISSIQDLIAEIEFKIETYNSIFYQSELKLDTLIIELNELYELRTQTLISGLSEEEIEIEIARIDEKIYEKTLLLEETLRINNYYNKLANTNQQNLNYYKDDYNNYTIKSDYSEADLEDIKQLKKDLTNLQADNSKEEYLAQRHKTTNENLDKVNSYESKLDEIETDINEIDTNIENLEIQTLTSKDKVTQQQNITEINRLKKRRAEKIGEYKTILTQYEFSKRNMMESELSTSNSDKLISDFYISNDLDTLNTDYDIYKKADELINTQKQKNLKNLAILQSNILNNTEYFAKTQTDFEGMIAENNNIREQQKANKNLLNKYENLHTETVNAEYQNIIEGKISVAKDLIEESEILAQSLDTITDNEKRKEITDQISENQKYLVSINNDINNTLAYANNDEYVADNDINTEISEDIEYTPDTLINKDDIIVVKTEAISSEIEKIESTYKPQLEKDRQQVDKIYTSVENEIIRIESETDPDKQKEIVDNLNVEYQKARKEHTELAQQEIKVNSEKYDYYNNSYDEVLSETSDNEKVDLSIKYRDKAIEFDKKSKDLLELAENTEDKATKQNYIIEASEYKNLAVNSYNHAYEVLVNNEITKYEELSETNDFEYTTKKIAQDYNDKVAPIIARDIENQYLALELKCDNYIDKANHYLNIADSLNNEIEALSLAYNEVNDTDKETIGESILELNKYRQIILDSAVNNIIMYHNTQFEINKAIITDKQNTLSDSEKQKTHQIGEEYAKYNKNSNKLRNSDSDYKYVLLGEVLVSGENLLKEQERIIGKLKIVNNKIQEFNKRINDVSSNMIATDAWLAQNAVTVSEYNLYTEQNIEETINEIASSSENIKTKNKFENLATETTELRLEIQDKTLEIAELESKLDVANKNEKEELENQLNKTKEDLTKAETQLEDKRKETALLAYESGKDLVETKRPVYKSVEETSRTLMQHADTLFNTAQTIRKEADEYRSQMEKQEYDERINKADELENEAVRTIAIANFVAQKDEPKVADKILKEHELRINDVKQYEFELIAENITDDDVSDLIETDEIELEELDVETDTISTQIIDNTETLAYQDSITLESEDSELLVITTDTSSNRNENLTNDFDNLENDSIVSEEVFTENDYLTDAKDDDDKETDKLEIEIETDTLLVDNNTKDTLIIETETDTSSNLAYIDNDNIISTSVKENDEIFTELIIQDKDLTKQYNSYSEDIITVNRKIDKTEERINTVISKDISPKRRENKLAKLERKRIKQENKLYAIELDLNSFVYENKLQIIDSLEVDNPEIYYYTENLLRESEALHRESEEIKGYLADNKKLTINEQNQLSKQAIEYDNRATEIQNKAIRLRIADDLSLIEDHIADNTHKTDDETTEESLIIEETIVTDDSLLSNTDNIDELVLEENLSQQKSASYPAFRILEFDNYVADQTNNNDVLDDSGLLFRIQFAAYNRIMPDGRFNMSPLFYEQIPDRNIVRYMVGTFYTFDGANYALPKVKAEGYNDAFIVAYYNGERISIYEANRLLAQKDEIAYNKQSTDEMNMVENNQDINKTPQYVLLEDYNTDDNKTDEQDNLNKIIDEDKPKNVNATNNVFLTVQIGAGRNLIDPNLLFGINIDYVEYANNGYVRHLNGTYFDLNSVINNRNRIRQIGIGDAFVSAYAYGEKVTVNQALQLLAQMSPEELAENTAKSFNTYSDEIDKDSITDDDIELTTNDENLEINNNTESEDLAQEITTEFYVQIGAYRREVDENLYSRFENIAQNKEIKLVSYDNGLIVYRIGSLSTYDNALIYQARAKAAGIQDAFIVVIRNGERIPLNQVL